MFFYFIMQLCDSQTTEVVDSSLITWGPHIMKAPREPGLRLHFCWYIYLAHLRFHTHTHGEYQTLWESVSHSCQPSKKKEADDRSRISGGFKTNSCFGVCSIRGSFCRSSALLAGAHLVSPLPHISPDLTRRKSCFARVSSKGKQSHLLSICCGVKTCRQCNRRFTLNKSLSL